MKNKKIRIAVIIILIIVLLIPIPVRLKDGGSVEYKTLFYKYTKIHRLNEKSSTGYEDGWELRILGKRIGGSTIIPVHVTAYPIKVTKKEVQDANKFNKYLERDNQIIYFMSNILEVYYYQEYELYSLKYWIENTWQTTSDGIKHLTDVLENTETLRDGGTKIYKNEKVDITIVTCNTLLGNKDIYIGDYSMDFDSGAMCK